MSGGFLANRLSISPLRYSGIDRIDNAAGYTEGNVVACCRICNRAKETLSVQEFAEWASRLGAMANQWGGEVKPKLIYDPLMGKEMEITGVLVRLASQENCDGDPYDQMMEAARYIEELEAIVVHLRAKP